MESFELEISPLFIEVLEKLEYQRFILDNELNIEDVKFSISSNDLIEAGWYGSIYASSEDGKLGALAQKFAVLLLYQYPENEPAVKLSYVILSRVGNLIASEYYQLLFENNDLKLAERVFKSSFGTILDFEVANKRDLNQVNLVEGRFLVTDFQKELWEELNDKNNPVSISAPTSSGKSFILQKYIKENLSRRKEYKVLYIVPTRALISQVSDRFRVELGSEVDIKTAYIDREPFKGVKFFANKEIYVVTPERCLKILEKESEGNFTPNLVFIDEIQNIENNDTRGVLFEYVLRQIKLLWKNSKVVTAGPFISKSGKLFEKIFGVSPLLAETELSPVSQLKAIISIEGDNEFKVILNKNESVFLEVPSEIDLYKEFSKSIGGGFAYLLSILGLNGPNLIYSPKTNLAESWARACKRKLLESGGERIDDPDVLEFIDFLKSEIHENYYLAECLEFGVAFHHGKLPEIVRKELEGLFISKKIKYLFCTSTLLQGVNLPALNMFIDVPKKFENKMSQFEFGNLIGRAGRFSESLYGTIYAIRRKRYNDKGELLEDWTGRYLNEEFTKEVKPATEFVLESYADNLIDNLEGFSNSVTDRNIEDTLVFIRHRYLENVEGVRDFLFKKNIEQEKIAVILSKLNHTMSDILISYEVMRKNPSVDPLLQNALSSRIDEEGVESWVIHVSGKLFERMKRPEAEKISIRSRPLFYQLETIMEKLDELFGFGYESFVKNQISMSVTQMVVYGLKWLENQSLGDIIKDDIEYYSGHDNISKRIDPKNVVSVNRRINDNIKINGTIVSFVLARYLKLLNDILVSKMNTTQLEKYKFSLALPTMLELGTKEPSVIEMISKGVPRSIAVAIFKILPEEDRENPMEWLSVQNELGIHPIYRKYLRRVGLIKV